MMAGGRTSAWRMTCRSASARPLETEFTLTHFSVRPRSSSASILGIVSLASVCEEAEMFSVWRDSRTTADWTGNVRWAKINSWFQHSVKKEEKKDNYGKKKILLYCISIVWSGSLTHHCQSVLQLTGSSKRVGHKITTDLQPHKPDAAHSTMICQWSHYTVKKEREERWGWKKYIRKKSKRTYSPNFYQ